MTARTYETIRVGLRRIIRDASVSAKVRMQAIERLMYLEGLLDENGHGAMPKNKSAIHQTSDANLKRMRELLSHEREKESA